jgi:Phage T7 tail fibre protein
MANSTQTVTSNGTLALLDISFDYFDRSEISVFFNSAQTSAWSWVGTTEKRIAFSPVVPNGVVVLVKRTTDTSEVRHEYSEGSAFTPNNIDESFKQVLHIAQEAKESNLSGEFFADINMNNFRVRNIGTAINDTDALSLGQYKADALGANAAKNTAVSAASAASASQAAAATSASTATASASAANTSASSSASSATAASGSASAAATSATNAGNSATASAASAAAAATSATNAANASRLTVGTTVTGSPGSSAAVTITGPAGSQLLNLTIPRGDTGPAGDVTAIQNNAYTAFTTAGTGVAYTLTPSPTITTYIAERQSFIVNFHATCGASPTLAVSGLTALALVEEDTNGVNVPLAAGRISAGKTYLCLVIPGLVKVIGLPPNAPFVRNMHNGFVLSTAGASATITVSPGQAADSTNTVLIDLAAALNKTTATWALGAGGGLSNGAVVASTWYHFYAIRNPSTGVTDVVFDTSATFAGVNTSIIGPAGFTQGRWIGVWRTNPSSLWDTMVQLGDDVFSYRLVNTNIVISATRTAYTVDGVPPIRVLLQLNIGGVTAGPTAFFSSDGAPDINPGSGTSAEYHTYRTVLLRTTPSGQVLIRASSGTPTVSVMPISFNIAAAKGR